MERFRLFLSSISKRCCFLSPPPDEPDLEVQGQSSIDLSFSQIQLQPLKEKIFQLKLTVTESETLPIGKSFIINPSGLVNSKRTLHGDGCVYAGSLYTEGTRVVNDIVLPENEKGAGKRHFMIEYRRQPKPSYFIKDLGDGLGTFVRITRPLALQTNHIISFGESHMIIIIDCHNPPSIVLKFIDGPKINQKFKFSNNNSPITIGRMTDCSIKFDDGSLSRYQCVIKYKGKWVIEDGEGSKGSTNGTWIFVEEFFEMHKNMIIKVGESTFSVDMALVD